MKALLVLLSVSVLSACSATTHNGVAIDNSAENPRGHITAEQRQCPKSRYSSLKKRWECKQEVHQALIEKNQTKANTEESTGSNQEETL
tara:strand:+ start:2783 stop:3049 length:267 start_codon:yes stop_codon:yes gene_type:complete